ncbi:MAG: LLM class F420-dependent oxidoreductase [Thermomicrobiales bacterium]
MKFSITVPRFVYDGGDAAIGPEFAALARDADAGGIDTLWVMDHFLQIPMVGEIDEPMLEGYSTLAFAAGVTERIRLGTLVTGATYRRPGLLVKTVTTLDVLSGGRAWFGVGAGWFEREHLALGVPFPSTSERFERLEETLQIANQMWSDNDGPFQGKHFQLAETLCQPQPVGHAHPPILIGGGGEKKTLRLVAKYADACNLFAMPTDEGMTELRHKLDVLREHCEREGRDYAAIEKTVMGPMPGDDAHQMVIPVAAFQEFVEQLSGLDIDTYIVPAIDRPHLDTLITASESLRTAGAAA